MNTNEKIGFEKIEGTARCACCNTFVSKQKMVQFPQVLLPMLNDPFEMGICPKCQEKKSIAELQQALETKHGRTMPEVTATVEDAQPEIIEEVAATAEVEETTPEVTEQPAEKVLPSNVTPFPSQEQENGMTNAEMIPLLKHAIDSNDQGGVNELKEKYPNTFQSSLKYLGNKREKKVQAMVDFNKIEIDVEVLKGSKLSKADVISFLRDLIDAGEIDKVKVLKEFHQELFEKSLKYLGNKRTSKLQGVI